MLLKRGVILSFLFVLQMVLFLAPAPYKWIAAGLMVVLALVTFYNWQVNVRPALPAAEVRKRDRRMIIFTVAIGVVLIYRFIDLIRQLSAAGV